MSGRSVIVVGAGLAGLNCARLLSAAGGWDVEIFERSDGIGGRVRTDVVGGFLLDRGFQVLLTSYPEARRALDFGSLRLHAFSKGARVRVGGRFSLFPDPRVHPCLAGAALTSPVGTLLDKCRLLRLAWDLRRNAAGAGASPGPDVPTVEYLRDAGFSERVIDRFFRPFFGGVFLDSGLRTSSRLFEELFRWFDEGRAALPEEGMGAVSAQLAGGLPPGAIRTGVRVTEITATGVRLDDGSWRAAEVVVAAVDGPSAASLLGFPDRGSRMAVGCQFAVSGALSSDRFLVLNGDGRGPIRHLAFPSAVCPSYAPGDRGLLSVSIRDEEADSPDEVLVENVRRQLGEWYGPAVSDAELLRVDRIPHAQFDQSAGTGACEPLPVRLESGVWICGDHRETSSIQGALVSGRRAAEGVMEGTSPGGAAS